MSPPPESRRARIPRHDRIWGGVCLVAMVPLAILSLVLHGSVL